MAIEKNLFDSKNKVYEPRSRRRKIGDLSLVSPAYIVSRILVYEIITRPDSSCRKPEEGEGRWGEERKNRETANTRYQTPRPYSKFLAPSIQFRYRHTHYPPNLIFAVKRRARTYPGREKKKKRGKKKKEKNEDPSTVNRAISNFQRSQHTARHLFIFERPRPNQFPFFDSLDRKLPVSLSLPLFFSSSKKKKHVSPQHRST